LGLGWIGPLFVFFFFSMDPLIPDVDAGAAVSMREELVQPSLHSENASTQTKLLLLAVLFVSLVILYQHAMYQWALDFFWYYRDSVVGLFYPEVGYGSTKGGASPRRGGFFSSRRNRVKNIVGKPVRSGACGIVNLGNTCYMGSTIQCLNSVKAFRSLFLGRGEGELNGLINEDSKFGSGGKVARAFAGLVRLLWNDKYSAIAPIEFKDIFGAFKGQFAGHDQQDSHEFLTQLLDSLHEDFNFASQDFRYRERGASFDNMNNSLRSQRALQEYCTTNRSPLMDIFLGQVSSIKGCKECGFESATFECTWQLSVQLPPPSIFLNIKIFPSSPLLSADTPVIFGVWVNKNPSISMLATHVTDMIAETYGREVEMSSIVLTTVVQDGSQAIADICSSSKYLRILQGGEMIYAFETERQHVVEKEEHSSSSASEDSESAPRHFVPFIHRLVGDRQDYSVVGIPGLIYIDEHFSLRNCLETICRLVASCVHEQHAEEAAAAAEQGNVHWLLNYGIVRVVSTSSWALKHTRGQDIPNFEEEAVEKFLPGRKVTITFDWYESSIFDTKIVNKLIQHPTFKGRPERDSSQSSVTLDHCLEHFFVEETLDDNNLISCAQCNKLVHGVKSISFVKLPPVLIILLKRFEDVFTKLTTNVDFPVNDLDMSSYLLPPSRFESEGEENATAEKDCLYDLVALSTHVGGLSSGHYTAYRRMEDDQWVYCNDEKITALSYERHLEPSLGIDTSSVYILVYKRKSFLGDPASEAYERSKARKAVRPKRMSPRSSQRWSMDL
jgi:ubiquitin C-terminal hydrolase